MNTLLKERNTKIRDELTDVNHQIDITKTIGRVKGSKNTSSELLISTFEIPQLMSNKVI